MPEKGKDNLIAVIKTGGKQYKVKEGDILNIEKLKAPFRHGMSNGKIKKIEFEDILSGKKVSAKILGEEKGEKVKILKFRRKTRYLRRQGHRQKYTKIQIEKINVK